MLSGNFRVEFDFVVNLKMPNISYDRYLYSGYNFKLNHDIYLMK